VVGEILKCSNETTKRFSVGNTKIDILVTF